MFDLVLYICSYGETRDETCKCLVNACLKSGYRLDVRWVTGDALIGRSRSRAASQFLWCDDSPFMVFIDSDIVFQPEDIEKIYRSQQAGYEIVAGMYSVADGTFVPAQGYKPLPFDGMVHEMKYVSTGFLGISRKALKQIRDTLKLPRLHRGDWCDCWAFFESGAKPDENIYISEDWFFCNLARTAGLKVYLHTGVKLGHIKKHVVSVDTAMQGMLQASYRQIAPINVDCIVQTTILKDLAGYLGKEEVEIIREMQLNDPCLALSEQWHKHSGSTEDFYRQGGAMHFYDLAMFNLQQAYWQQRIAPIALEQDKDVIDVGCGIGSASLFMAQNRNKVRGIDLNPTLIDFCNYRKQKLGLSNVSFSTELPESGSFDLMLAIDMLEHIEELEPFLMKLGKLVKSGGKLYHVDMFENHHEVRPFHFDHSKIVDECLHKAGFRKFDNLWAVKA